MGFADFLGAVMFDFASRDAGSADALAGGPADFVSGYPCGWV